MRRNVLRVGILFLLTISCFTAAAQEIFWDFSRPQDVSTGFGIGLGVWDRQSQNVLSESNGIAIQFRPGQFGSHVSFSLRSGDLTRDLTIRVRAIHENGFGIVFDRNYFLPKGGGTTVTIGGIDNPELASTLLQAVTCEVVPGREYSTAFFLDDLHFFKGSGSFGDSATFPPAPSTTARSSSDTRIVRDHGPYLDTPCWFRTNGPLEIGIDVRRVVGATDPATGLLRQPELLVQQGFLSRYARLTIAAWDIDPGENDVVAFNGRTLGTLRGANNQWSRTTFLVPIGEVHFASFNPGMDINAVANTPGTNTVRIDVDQQGGNGTQRCTSVDWVGLEFGASAPIFFVHGTAADPSSWSESTDIDEYLDALGFPYARSIELDGAGSIAKNGRILKDQLRVLADAFGTSAFHLVAHSKGGNDSREYLKYYASANPAKALSLYTYSTPFRGSVSADVLVEARSTPLAQQTASHNDAIDRLLFVDSVFIEKIPFTPHGDALVANTVAFMAGYNDLNPGFPCCAHLYNFGADADLNDDREISTEETQPLFPLASASHIIADANYQLLGQAASVELYRVNNAGPYWIDPSRVNATFHQNDLAVTLQSATHPNGTVLGYLDGNHASMKRASTIQQVLNRIKADFPVHSVQ